MIYARTTWGVLAVTLILGGAVSVYGQRVVQEPREPDPRVYEVHAVEPLLPGEMRFLPVDMNDDEIVVGQTFGSAQGREAAVTGMALLSPDRSRLQDETRHIRHPSSTPHAVNNEGYVLFNVEGDDGNVRAKIMHADRSVQQFTDAHLVAEGVDGSVIGTAINDDGVVAGYLRLPNSHETAFRWDPNERRRHLRFRRLDSHLDEEVPVESRAVAILDDGTVIAHVSNLDTAEQIAVFWSRDRVQPIRGLVDNAPRELGDNPVTFYEIHDTNGRDIVGRARFQGFDALVATRNGGEFLIDLGRPAPGDRLSMNAEGFVAGFRMAGRQREPFVWYGLEEVYPLEELINDPFEDPSTVLLTTAVALEVSVFEPRAGRVRVYGFAANGTILLGPDRPGSDAGLYKLVQLSRAQEKMLEEARGRR